MTFDTPKKIHLLAIIIYTIVSYFIQNLVQIHWIHIFNSLMLSSILYNLLDFKFNCEEGDNNGISEI